jgi:prolyl oligopeptidase
LKIWKRGTPLAAAETLFVGRHEDVSVYAEAEYLSGINETVLLISQATSFYTYNRYMYVDGGLRQLDLPHTLEYSGIYEGRYIVEVTEDWTVRGQTYKAGSLLGVQIGLQNIVDVIFTPTDISFIDSVAVRTSGIYFSTLKNVENQVFRATWGPNGYETSEVAIPSGGNVGFYGSTGDASAVYVSYASFLVPTTQYLIEPQGASTKVVRAKGLPDKFASSDFEAEQHFAKSADGTRIPYFVVRKKGTSGVAGPTLMSGYGGFRVSRKPTYLQTQGRLWLEQGGKFVLANIRGGGEFGPKWHESAILKNKMKSYEDFIAVAEDLIANGETSPQQLGIQGGSNGGLLVSAVMVLRPDLFQAVVCEVPLVDMIRYHLLLAGASWMAEYGNPDDPEMREYILRYSPYQNLRAGVKYPEMFVDTSTKDDRVHPGHARKLVARLEEFGQPVLYFENTEGGHAGAATPEQRAELNALVYTYLKMKLGGD